MLSSTSDKAKLFAEKFSKYSNLDDSGVSLPVFPSRTHLKLHNISITPKMIKKLIMNLDLSKASGPDCIPVMVLKNCEPKLSYILAKLFNKCLKESCFPNCRKVSLVVPVFKNVGERSTAKNYCPISLLSVVSKVFEKLVNNRLFISYTNVAFFFISSVVLGLLDQLQINAGVPKGYICGLTLFLLYINDLPHLMMLSVILLSMPMILLFTLYMTRSSTLS